MITRVWVIASAVASCFVFAPSVFADAPVLSGTAPLGVQRGVASDVAINGSHLADNPRLLAPFPCAVEQLPNSDGSAWRVKLNVPASVALGVYPIRIKTDDGISNPILFAVGQAPVFVEKEPNDAPSNAQAIGSPAAVDGQVSGNDVDYVRFPGKKGQRIVVDAQCSRIGSGVDPQIRLTTAIGAFVASADDTPGLLTDARIVTTLPEDGDYVVEISDSKYQGAGRPVYRLTIGPLPVAAEVYPLGGRRGETVGFEARQAGVGEIVTAAAVLPLDPNAQPFYVSFAASPTETIETPYSVELSDLPEIREPADPKAPAPRATFPVVLNGRIDPEGDEDRFVLAVAPGQALRIRVQAADLGSALDGTLQILGAAGNQLAAAEDTVAAPVAGKGQKRLPQGLVSVDPALDFTVPAAVTEITLALRDLIGRGGVGFPYRVVVEPITPGFEVLLNESQVSVPKNGDANVGVTILRQGYNGPITLGVADPPAGLEVRPGTIAAGATIGSFTVRATADAVFEPSVLKITGTGQGASGPIVEEAVKDVVFAQQANLPTNSLTIRGLPSALAKPRPVVADAAAAPIEVVHGYGAGIPLKLKRSDGADAALAIAAFPMPPGLTVAAGTIAEKAADGSVTVNAAPEAPLGQQSITLHGKGKFGDKEVTIAIPAVLIDVVRPAAIELAAPSVEIKAGAEAEIKGKLIRKGPFKEPVKLALGGLPAGVKAEPVTVAADASEFSFKLSAEANAAAAEAKGTITAAFQINKKDYPTPPVPVSVKLTK